MLVTARVWFGRLVKHATERLGNPVRDSHFIAWYESGVKRQNLMIERVHLRLNALKVNQ